MSQHAARRKGIHVGGHGSRIDGQNSYGRSQTCMCWDGKEGQSNNERDWQVVCGKMERQKQGEAARNDRSGNSGEVLSRDAWQNGQGQRGLHTRAKEPLA
ncbi:hypothetical protein R1flu_022786 [Riccia fluitans]|uniref:Uncharacterized protein n=1 Tax=Riccia fluitans TaxID=41844 RepID=A0ABD1XQ70_9MARC